MSAGLLVAPGRRTAAPLAPALVVGMAVAASALLAGTLPVGLSLGAVFLFAGPHNWFEARYALARLPARWGPFRPFFLVSLAGIVGLTAWNAALSWRPGWLGAKAEGWATATALWESALVGWIWLLVAMRQRQKPRRDWPAATPLALVAMAAAWLAPGPWAVALVFAHPLVALWVLDRELARHRPGWRAAFRLGGLAIPLAVLALVVTQAGAAPLADGDPLTTRLVHHAGGDWWARAGFSTRLPVALHAFLELLHYAVWLVAIPLVALKAAPWRWRAIPMARRPGAGRGAALAVLAGGASLVLALWAGFAADYGLTRDVYFTLALVHVLAEVPLLLRLL